MKTTIYQFKALWGFLLAVLAVMFLHRRNDWQAVANAYGEEGIHEEAYTRKADAAFTDRHLLAKEGSDDQHFALCGASDMPIGVCPDEDFSAEDNVTLYLLGATDQTRLMVASEAIDEGDVLYTAADGKVQNTPAVSGLFWRVGVAKSNASSGELVEVETCQPVREAISAGSTTKAGATLAVPITHRFVTMTTGGAEALTLANGFAGQILTLYLGTDGGDGTLTPTTKSGFATIVFADAGDQATLEYIDDTIGWVIVDLNGVAAPPAKTV